MFSCSGILFSRETVRPTFKKKVCFEFRKLTKAQMHPIMKPNSLIIAMRYLKTHLKLLKSQRPLQKVYEF